MTDMTPSDRPRIAIEYCTQCQWLLRAAWMAQELLLTFEQEVGGVTLILGTGGIFEIRVGDTLLWSRKDQGGFPQIKELKRLVRDHIVGKTSAMSIAEPGRSDRRLSS